MTRLSTPSFERSCWYASDTAIPEKILVANNSKGSTSTFRMGARKGRYRLLRVRLSVVSLPNTYNSVVNHFLSVLLKVTTYLRRGIPIEFRMRVHEYVSDSGRTRIVTKKLSDVCCAYPYDGRPVILSGMTYSRTRFRIGVLTAVLFGSSK